MKLSNTIAVAAIAVAPMAASAALVTIGDGGTTNLATFGDTYQFVVDTNANGFTHTFVVDNDGEGVAAVSLNQLIAPFFSGVTVTWSANGSVLASGTNDQLVTTSFTNPGSLTQTLDVTWTGAPANSEFDGAVTLSAVPVPAGLVLMATALAGLGLARRKS